MPDAAGNTGEIQRSILETAAVRVVERFEEKCMGIRDGNEFTY